MGGGVVGGCLRVSAGVMWWRIFCLSLYQKDLSPSEFGGRFSNSNESSDHIEIMEKRKRLMERTISTAVPVLCMSLE
jgi:hypothetical protein